MKKQIIIDVTDEGEVKITTKGFSGASCLEDTKFLKDLLGSETARNLTPCFYQKNNQPVKKYLPICG